MNIELFNHCFVALLQLMVLVSKLFDFLKEFLIDLLHFLGLFLKRPGFRVYRGLTCKLRDLLFEGALLVGSKSTNFVLQVGDPFFLKQILEGQVFQWFLYEGQGIELQELVCFGQLCSLCIQVLSSGITSFPTRAGWML